MLTLGGDADRILPMYGEKERAILAVAIEIINSEGFEALTARNLAKQAGINSASINYYFRSKEIMVEQALSLAFDSYFTDLDSIVDGFDGNLDGFLQEFISYNIEGFSKYANLTRMIFFSDFYKEANPFVDKINSLMDELESKLAQSGFEDSCGIAFRLKMFFSSMVAMASNDKLFRSGVSSEMLMDAKILAEFIKL
ncbi:MAG: TetR/AcrR family transcriptional regulator [Spirochaetales bacterium]|nr:TetR/AcrR family transcriptional regulator [Spirochaetales bacterium]